VTGRRRAAGFTLVGVVVAIAILTILIAAVGPSVYAVVQRDKEMELIFRGRQYARAVQFFQRRFGRLPTSLRELTEARPRMLRKKFKDPMCNCDDWQLIIAGTPDAVPPGSGGGSGLPGPGRSALPPGAGNRPPGTYTGMFPTPPGGPDAPPPTPGFPSLFGTPTNQVVGPIVGVRSKVHKRGYRKWRELDYYDEWKFIAGDADKDVGGGRVFAPGAPGGPGGPGSVTTPRR
jgi:type II secretory pathway pseudopilin PulG